MFDIFGKQRIAQLEESLAGRERLFDILLMGWKDQSAQLRGLKDDIRTNNIAIGRIIAKLDPIYNISEYDPVRIEESNRISEEAINRIYAEHAASNKHTGEHG